jgi:hypothetical protein
MNEQKIHNAAYFFPFCALAARYKDDSLDGDKDLTDCINDTVKTEWVPGAKIHYFYDPAHLDFSYAVEDEKHGHLLIVKLGTEGKIHEAGWYSDFSPGLETHAFRELGGHVDFISAGQRLYDHFYNLIYKYRTGLYFTGHSRGDPIVKAAARASWRLTGEIPTVVGYCGPACFTHAAADEYDKTLGSGTTTVDNANDITDNVGIGLKHVGTALHLPRTDGGIVDSVPVLGKIVGGHAYTKVFDGLIKYCGDRKMSAEVDYLETRKWVCKI